MTRALNYTLNATPPLVVMATHYDRGRAFEYKVRDHFKALGYFVIRSAGSKGKVDLCAISPAGDMVFFVQCKAGRITSRERQEAAELEELSAWYGARGILAYKEDGKLVLEELS